MKERAPWRNRIVRYADVPPEQLLANAKNWRIHSQLQQETFEDVADEVGIVAPVTAVEGTDTILDGHMRVALAMRRGQPTIPVAFSDVDESEADKVIATFDPIGAMAITDRSLYGELADEIATDSERVRTLIDEIAAAGTVAVDEGESSDQSDLLREQWSILVECASETEQHTLLQRFIDEGLSCRALIS